MKKNEVEFSTNVCEYCLYGLCSDCCLACYEEREQRSK